MKLTKKLLVCLTLIASVAMAGTPTEETVPIDHVFAPHGFDSNDNVELIVTGFLPNLCHKAPTTKVNVKGDKIFVEVTSLYYEESNPFCPEMVVPFTKAVSLGILDKGRYDIVVNNKTQWEKKEEIKIAESVSNSIDDFSYAYVTYIEKENTPFGKVVLKGYNPSDCFELESIDYVHNGKDTYSVLPKMKQVRELCPMKMIPFEYEWEVPRDLDTNKVLLHVRTMEGNSVNTIFFR